MKDRIFATVIFLTVIVLSISNSLFLVKETDEMILEVKGLQTSDGQALSRLMEIDEGFRKKANYIGLTVSHDDLTNIEDCLAELKGHLAVGDIEGAEVTKSRLIRFLEHLRRLVGFNIDNII